MTIIAIVTTIHMGKASDGGGVSMVDIVSRNEAQNAMKWAEEFVNKAKEIVLEQGR
jgi:hypothetical protein